MGDVHDRRNGRALWTERRRDDPKGLIPAQPRSAELPPPPPGSKIDIDADNYHPQRDGHRGPLRDLDAQARPRHRPGGDRLTRWGYGP